ncbi:MAG: TetR/AcrR family transcriptional regulator [Candidatus Zixiibacteriota bacterium]
MDKKALIIKASQILFAQFGLKKVTTDDIAREGHISKATIYKYFKNKNEIFDAVIKDEIDQLLAEIRAAIDLKVEVPDKLKAHLMTRLGKVHEFANFYRVTYETWGDYWPHIAQFRKQFLKEEQEIVKNILIQGIKRNELVINNVEMAAHVLIVALASLEFQWALDEYHISLETMVDNMLEMMMHGIYRR